MRFTFFSLLFIIHTLTTFSQISIRNDAVLERKLRAAMANFQGDAGIYVRNLRTGKTVAINADTLFPTASMVKIPIQCGLFDKIYKGELTYDQELIYKDSLHYDDGIIGSLKDGAKITLSKVVMLMETVSDNTGSLWCQALAGGGTSINTWLETNGFHQTRVNSRTPGREANRTQYGWGQTSPREMAELLTYIRQGKAISPDASEEMYRNLGRQHWDNDGLSQVPPDVKIASKNGAVNQARSEVVFVHAPHGEYVYCVMTKNQKDESWTRTNEGYTLLRAVAATLWHHFEPKSTWKPAEGYEKWW
ncbi:serine hydrolase [Spirosoma sp. KCTC 42546]|uniref:serine hydrolase n=1 Tax=Spirosoma sp. KCTC 42546 TaxID=2520506 RepID=UPI0011576F27|nr:serine hydrolase [Spirosoma sp. KCTC 42546]QDK78507.1 serine hydrolase [Spirosoma sp. KCTC 42546]